MKGDDYDDFYEDVCVCRCNIKRIRRIRRFKLWATAH